MPRTARTDPFDRPCAVRGCENVEANYGICKRHLREVTTHADRMRFAVEQMTGAHELKRKHERQVKAAARAAGMTLVERKSFAERDAKTA